MAGPDDTPALNDRRETSDESRRRVGDEPSGTAANLGHVVTLTSSSSVLTFATWWIIRP